MSYTHLEIISNGEKTAAVLAQDEAGFAKVISGNELFIGDEHATAYQHAVLSAESRP